MFSHATRLPYLWYWTSVLNDLGIHAHVPEDGHPAFAGWLHLVRRLRANQALQVIGLAPASDRVSGSVVGVQLGVAMAHASGVPVTVLDFNTVRPAWQSQQLTEHEDTAFKEVSPKVSVMRIAHPTERNDWGWVRGQLQALCARGHYVLCDLTGLQQMSQLDEGLALVHGAVSLVRPGHVWEWQLSRLHKHFGTKDLGVLLVESGKVPRKTKR
jgi:hypothetical protein